MNDGTYTPNWIEQLAIDEVRRVNPSLYARIPYAGGVERRGMAQCYAMRDNHMALRAAARELLDSHEGDGDPRWARLRRLLEE